MAQKSLNKYILAIVVLALLLPTAFLGGVILSETIKDDFSLTADSLSSWISAGATVAIAVLTFILAKETWYLREAQARQLSDLQRDSIRPYVDFSLVHSRVDFHFIDLKIANYGRGVARNIKFKLVSDLGCVSVEGTNPVVDSIFKLGAIKNGISNLGIGQVYKSFVFSFLDVIQKIGEDEVFLTKFSVEMTYCDTQGYEYKNTVFIDMSSFSGIIELGGGDPIYKMAKSLDKISAWAQGLTSSSSKRINVNSYSNADRVRERKALEVRYEAFQKAKIDKKVKETDLFMSTRSSDEN